MFDKDEQELSRIIAEGLESILTGKLTVEQVLAAHPEQAALIRPQLEAAVWLGTRRAEVSMRPGFVNASRKRLVKRIQDESSAQGAKHAFFGLIWPERIAYRWVAALSICILLLTGMGGMVTLSQAALPGDDLYQVKRAYEQVVIQVTPNEAHRAALASQFSRRRLDEAQALISKGDFVAAESSLADFEQGVNQAITLLQQVDDKQLDEKQDAAITVKQELASNAEKLTEMAPKVPTDIQTVVARARDTSLNGVVMAGRVIDQVNDKKLTPTPSPVYPSPTSRPRSESTPQPLLPGIPPAGSRSTATALPGTSSNGDAPTVVVTPYSPSTPTSPPVGPSVPTVPVVTVIPPAPPTATPTATDTPTDLPTVTDTPVPPAPTNTPWPSDTPAPTPTDTVVPPPVPTATDTPVQPVAPLSSTASPMTPTATPSAVYLSGSTQPPASATPTIADGTASGSPTPATVTPTPTPK